MLAAHHLEIAALIVEPLMQGAAGMWAHPVAYLQTLRELATRYEILLICDEGGDRLWSNGQDVRL